MEFSHSLICDFFRKIIPQVLSKGLLTGVFVQLLLDLCFPRVSIIDPPVHIPFHATLLCQLEVSERRPSIDTVMH